MTSLLAVSPSCPCDRWMLCILPVPVLRFLPVAIVLLPEQVIAVMIVRNRHIEGTPRVPFPVLRHLHIDLAEFGVPDGKLPIRRRSGHLLVLGLLRRAPDHPAHV